MNESPEHRSTWYRATQIASPRRSALAADLDVDVCVIGGGLAGLTTAFELVKRGKSVALLEAKRLAWNASGCNGGFVTPGFAEDMEKVIKRVGLDHAKELWRLSQGGVDYVRRLIEEHALQGVVPKNGRLTVQRINRPADAEQNVRRLRDDFKADVEFWPTERVRAALLSQRYYQAVHLPKAFHMHPLNYALGLADLAEKAGVQIFEDTRALSIDASMPQKIISTPQAKVRAAHVVYCCSSRVNGLNKKLDRAILPIFTYVAVTAPLGERLAEAIRTQAGVADTRRAGDYYRIVDGDRLLWGGRITAFRAAPHLLKGMMRGDILKTYPQLDPIDIDYAWAGQMGYALHKMPQIGEFEPGQWVASAFGGHGLNTTAMAGELIAAAIAEGDDRWRLFSPYGLTWTGGPIGRIGVQMAYWSMQMLDFIEERLSCP